MGFHLLSLYANQFGLTVAESEQRTDFLVLIAHPYFVDAIVVDIDVTVFLQRIFFASVAFLEIELLHGG